MLVDGVVRCDRSRRVISPRKRRGGRRLSPASPAVVAVAVAVRAAIGRYPGARRAEGRKEEFPGWR